MTVTILIGDSLHRLRELPDNSVHCVVTSPPYWGLRDYDVEGQMGLEPTLDEHIANMVALFEEVRRVLHPSGTLWLNYGDCYATTPNGRSAADQKAAGTDDRTFRDKPFSTIGGGIKAKDLCMIPNRLAIALQLAGWYVRSEIIWAKPNPMPDSSGKLRPSTAHEKIFLLAKSGQTTCWRHDDGRWEFATEPEPDYIWRNFKTGEILTTPTDDEAFTRVNLWRGRDFYYEPADVAQATSGNTHARRAQNISAQAGSTRANGGTRPERPMKAVGNQSLSRRNQQKSGGVDNGKAAYFGDIADTPSAALKRGRAKDGADSARPPGSRPHSLGKFEADNEREYESRFLRNYEPAPVTVWNIPVHGFQEAHFATFPPDLADRCIKAGCRPQGVVLDPFGGAGTTALVADRRQRDCILIELNPTYAEIARRRIDSDAGPLAPPVKVDAPKLPEYQQLDLLAGVQNG